MMVNRILTALKGKIPYHQIQSASLDNDPIVMNFMFLIYEEMRRQVSDYGTHYSPVYSQNNCLHGFNFSWV